MSKVKMVWKEEKKTVFFHLHLNVIPKLCTFWVSSIIIKAVRELNIEIFANLILIYYGHNTDCNFNDDKYR